MQLCLHWRDEAALPGAHFRACGVSILTGNPLSYNEKTATAVNQHFHGDGHDHAASIENFEIVGHANNKFHLHLKESPLIGVVRSNIVNVQKKSVPLSLSVWWAM